MLTDRNSQYYGFPEGSIEFFYLVRTVAPKPGSDRHINRCFSVLLLLTFSKAAEWHLYCIWRIRNTRVRNHGLSPPSVIPLHTQFKLQLSVVLHLLKVTEGIRFDCSQYGSFAVFAVYLGIPATTASVWKGYNGTSGRRCFHIRCWDVWSAGSQLKPERDIATQSVRTNGFRSDDAGMWPVGMSAYCMLMLLLVPCVGAAAVVHLFFWSTK